MMSKELEEFDRLLCDEGVPHYCIADSGGNIFEIDYPECGDALIWALVPIPESRFVQVSTPWHGNARECVDESVQDAADRIIAHYESTLPDEFEGMDAGALKHLILDARADLDEYRRRCLIRSQRPFRPSARSATSCIRNHF